MQNEAIRVNGMDITFRVNGKDVFTDSLVITKVFDKEHNDILKAIRRVATDEDFNEGKITLVKYKDKKGEMRPLYLLDRDMFSLVVMGFTGEKAMQWKRNFIKAFNEMEKRLLEQQPKIPTSYLEALEQLVETEKKRLQLETTLKKEQPRIEFAKQVEHSVNAIKIQEWVKAISKDNKTIGRNRAFKWLRDKGYLKIKTTTVATSKGIREFFTTLITGKGQIALANMIVSELTRKDK